MELPEGFVLEGDPSLPDGFVLEDDNTPNKVAPEDQTLPEGFVLEGDYKPGAFAADATERGLARLRNPIDQMKNESMPRNVLKWLMNDEPEYGKRVDGTEKAKGYLGEIPTADGRVMTEMSVGVEIDGKETLIPSIVPTLTEDEIKYLAEGGSPLTNDAIMDKAVAHARKRIAEGKSPFIEKRQSRSVDPVSTNISNLMSEMEAANMQDTEDYKRLEQEFFANETLLESEDAKLSWDMVKAAVKEDPVGFGAEFANAISADPYLLAVPMGWTRAAGAAAKATQAMGKTTQAVAKVAAGATGTSALAAATTAPIVLAEQLATANEVDREELIDTTVLAAIAGPVLVGGFKGVSRAAKAAKDLDAKIMGYGSDPAAPAHASAGAAATMGAPASSGAPGFFGRMGRRATAAKDLVIDLTGGKAITPIRKAGENSPTMQKLAEMLEPPETVTGPVASRTNVDNLPHHARVSVRTGNFITRLQEALTPLTGRWYGLGEGAIPYVMKAGAKLVGKKLRAVNQTLNDDILAGLRGKAHSVEAAPAVRAIRSLLDDLHAYAKKAGVKIGHIDNYFPRVYNPDALTKLEDAFLKVLMKYGIDPADAYSIHQRILDTDGIYEPPKRPIDPDNPPNPALQGHVARGRVTPMGERMSGTKSSAELSRKLAMIPDEELAPFLSQDLYPVLVKYTENLVRRAEHVRSFGKDGAKLVRMLNQGVRESVQAGSPMPRVTVQRAADIANALQGAHQPIVTSAAQKANVWVTTYQLLRTLPLAVISSFSEIFIPLTRAAPHHFAAAVAPTINHAIHELIRSVDKKFPKAEATRALEELGLGLDGALAERLTSAFGGETTQITAAFFKFNALHDFTKFTRVLANETGKRMVLGHIRRLHKGGLRKATEQRYIRELRELGIEPADAMEWMNRGGALTDKYYNAIKHAGMQFTNEIVMNPRSTVRPMWHSNPHFHTLSQLKGFQTVFGNTVVKRAYQDISRLWKGNAEEGAIAAAKYASAASLMIYAAMLGNELRERIKYGPGGNPKFKNEPAVQTLIRAVDRTGFTGIAQWGLDATLAHRFGSSGVASILGPAYSQADEILEAAGMYREAGSTNKINRELVNAVPILNAHKPSRDAMVDWLNQ